MTNARIREALTAGAHVKEKGPPVADGILSVTSDTLDVAEWRSRSTLDNAETCSTYLDEDDDGNPKPHELYGKFTWKIENFSEISKRELRSNVFDVGSYKWYILVYPQGCDVCNHLSLFLCVADYDKLLPGWSHFAQFTIAVVNKDPKKSKYSDTLHRFCKKEHDWGWKKFMELSKVLDGFTVSDTLVIKAQVQVILDKPGKPFRCLDPQYRRELVRVYLTNVEGICRRFCEEKRLRLSWLKEDGAKFTDFWVSLTPEQQRKYLTEKGESLLKGLVKQFFNEKEVTSTLVMDALYSGCKQIEDHSRQWMEGKPVDGAPLVLIKGDRNALAINADLGEVAERLSREFIPALKDDKSLQALPADSLALRSGQDGEDYRRDSVERDEKRLAELGRKTVEMYVIAHIFSERLEIAYREAEALRRQDQLIAEEEEAGRLNDARVQARAAAEKERRAKKKERMKQKKEVEKAKREAEDEEKRRVDDLKRQETERKAKEMADKKRQEEALAAQQQQQMLLLQQQQQQRLQQNASTKARMERSSAEASTKPAPAPAPAVAKTPVKSPPAAEPRHTSRSPAPRPSVQEERSTPVTRSSVVAETSSFCGSSSRGSSPGSQFRSAASSDLSDSSSSTADVGVSSAHPDMNGEDSVSTRSAGYDDGRSALESDVVSLREHVRYLEWKLAEQDAEIFALRAQLAELQPTEIADAVKQAAAAKERNGSNPSAASSSAAASTAAAAATLGMPLVSESSSAHGMEVSGSPSLSASASASSADAEPTAAAAEPTPAPAAAAVAAASSNRSASPAVNLQDFIPQEPSKVVDASHTNGVREHAPVGPAPNHRRSNLVPGPVFEPSSSSTSSSSAGGHVGGSAAAAAAATAVSRGLPTSVLRPGSAVPFGSQLRPGTSGHEQPTPSTNHSLHTPGPGYVPPPPTPVLSSVDPLHHTPRSVSLGPSSLTSLSDHHPQRTPSYSQLSASSQGTVLPHAVTANGRLSEVLPTTSTKAVTSTATQAFATAKAGLPNGTIGSLHSLSTVSDSIPSYRNAAAGVLPANAPHVMSVAAAAQQLPAASASLSGSKGLEGGGSSGVTDDGDAASAAAVSAAVGAAVAATTHALSEVAFPGTGLGMMAAAAAAASQQALAYTPVTSKHQAPNLDSPGLDDFAHMGLIDDLLTE